MADEDAKSTSNRARAFQFGLRSVMLVLLLTAAYFAGWQSHKAFHNRNLKSNIDAAIAEIESGSVKMENAGGTGIVVLRGKREDVARARDVVSRVQKAAGE